MSGTRQEQPFTWLLIFLCLGSFSEGLQAQVQGTLRSDQSVPQGAALNGQVLLFAPTPAFLGSSVGHWDQTAAPPLLMMTASPSLTYAPESPLDISPQQMADIGWRMGESQFNILDFSQPGTGFDDATPFAGAPGNPAATLGEARLAATAEALQIWGQTLASSVPIDVEFSWFDGNCGLLGAAAPNAAKTQGQSLPLADTWYPTALVEALTGSNLSEFAEDMYVLLSSDVDRGCLGEGIRFYYGLDGAEPPGTINFIALVLHEVAHGLGMYTTTDSTTGAFSRGSPSVYDRFVRDLTTGKTWDQMTNAERRASAKNDKYLVWDGANANAAAAAYLDPGSPVLEIDELDEPNRFLVTLNRIGPTLTPEGLTAPLACAEDSGASAPVSEPFLARTTDACDPLINNAEVTGKIVLVEDGNCPVLQKALHVQEAGGLAAAIVSSSDWTPAPEADSPQLAIPMVMMKRSEGKRLRQAVCPVSAPDLVFANWLSGIFGATRNNTRLILYNASDFTDRVQIRFRDRNGDPISVSIGEQEETTFEAFVLPRSVADIETDAVGPLISGTLEVLSELGAAADLDGTAILKAVGSFVSVPDSTPGPQHRVFVSVSSEENTGIALYNPDAENPIRLDLLLLSEFGEEKASRQVALGPRQQLLSFVTEEAFFKEFFDGLGEDFKGTLHITVFAAHNVSVLGLLQKSDGVLVAVSPSPATAVDP